MNMKEVCELIFSEAEEGKTDNQILCKILSLEGVKDGKEQLENIRKEIKNGKMLDR